MKTIMITLFLLFSLSSSMINLMASDNSSVEYLIEDSKEESKKDKTGDNYALVPSEAMFFLYSYINEAIVSFEKVYFELMHSPIYKPPRFL